ESPARCRSRIITGVLVDSEGAMPQRRRSAAAAFAPLLTTVWMLLGTGPAADPFPYRLPGGAADPADPFIAAGFRALFTCSAHFATGRPLDAIVGVELADTAPLGLPPPEIDAARQLVRASDGRGHVRIAAFRDTMGCTILPPHWTEADLGRLPYVARPLPEPRPDLDFPLGERAEPDAAQ